MKKSILSLILLFSAGFVFASENDSTNTGDKFAQLDTNKDHSISKEEASADSALAKIFESLDLDKNTQLSQKEFDASKTFTDASQ